MFLPSLSTSTEHTLTFTPCLPGVRHPFSTTLIESWREASISPRSRKKMAKMIEHPIWIEPMFSPQHRHLERTFRWRKRTDSVTSPRLRSAPRPGRACRPGLSNPDRGPRRGGPFPSRQRNAAAPTCCGQEGGRILMGLGIRTGIDEPIGWRHVAPTVPWTNFKFA